MSDFFSNSSNLSEVNFGATSKATGWMIKTSNCNA